MKTTFALAAVAGFAAAASAQSIYFTASNDLPANGELVTIDVVLDATDYQGAFGAWQGYSFNVGVDSSGRDLVASDLPTPTEAGGGSETAELVTGGQTIAGTGGAWVDGRRPFVDAGTIFNPTAPGFAGDSRFGVAGSETYVVTDDSGDLLLSSAAGRVAGAQAAPAPPQSNQGIHSGRIYEAFRFTFTYTNDMGLVTFDLVDLDSASLYDSLASAAGTFVTDTIAQNSLTIGIPTPASAALLGLGGLTAARRRRA